MESPRAGQHLDELLRLAANVKRSADELHKLVTSVKEADLGRLRHILYSFELWMRYLAQVELLSATFTGAKIEPPDVQVDATVNHRVENILMEILKAARTRDFSTQTRELVKGLDRLLDQQLDKLAAFLKMHRSTSRTSRLDERDTKVLADIEDFTMQMMTHMNDRLQKADDLWAAVAAQEDARKAKDSAVAAQEAAGMTSDAALSSYYGELAKEEKDAANTFRRITVTMAFTGAGSTALFVAGPSLGLDWLELAAGDFVHLIQRGVFVAGVFGLAGYFARQAHQHRSMANWASALAVQLKTFDAYLRAVENPDAKDELRKSFAARVFGDHPAMKGEPTVTPSAAAMDTAVGWAAKLMPGGK
jgi:hypothetical protein